MIHQGSPAISPRTILTWDGDAQRPNPPCVVHKVVISAALRRKGKRDMGKGRARDLNIESEVWPALSEEHCNSESTEARRFKERPGHRRGSTDPRLRGSAVPGWCLAEN